MTEYERKVYEEIQAWERKIVKQSGLFNRLSKKAQTKLNGMIPEKVHRVITESIKNMVKATLFGSNLIQNKGQSAGMGLQERDVLLQEKLATYRKTAVVEGAGTGAGGIFLGIADFPLLLSIKMKFLFDAAAVYGFDANKYEERLFILHVFQLAFSNDEKRRETLHILKNWEIEKEKLVDMDWRAFQQEYRDYIDLVKMLQLVPGFGAIVGAYANYNLLDQLGETAMNIYRMRILATKPRDY
ncbi:EcsC family protein [Virgibacillus dakarensis]|uniref:ABC transporter-associated protein EcsC n=1 Tax=Lentibacillus populi TaxID=1827502 RepID=A0A9W5TZF2_9BACI|nr:MULTISPECIES: EcsC family protein [Bacillaceae]MBT2217010.1 EcsC family protein [Virgibacillus dakarensis]MTW86925.1 EcsC family protein [Virgibacillus dakarensis]GGB52531.1 ABC transporter-associated protein EcsC [Lentibacillus populi]